MNPQTNSPLLKWIVFNLVLLSLYLGFFYLGLVLDFPESLAIGWAMAAAAAGLCFRFRKLFLNRYEFLFYLALPLDIALESLIPEHMGYSFYACAASFWSVFIVYRIYLAIGPNANGRLEAERLDTVEQPDRSDRVAVGDSTR